MAKRRQKRPHPQIPQESRAAELVTVLWMLSALTTLVCEIGLLAAMGYLHSHSEAQYVAALYFLLWLTAIVAGTLTVALVPIVLKLRIQPPPPVVTMAAVIMGTAPWAMLIM